MKILHLKLKKKWFDMIVSGVKKEEYREIKPYWDKRLNKSFDIVRFKNGYAEDSPTMDIELIEIITGQGKTEWGGSNKEVYILKLGKIIKSLNIQKSSASDTWNQIISKPLGAA